MAYKCELKDVNNIRDIQCPYCQEVIDEKQTAHWDFIDLESRLVVCKHCKKTYRVIINRPIEFIVGRKESF